MKYAEKGLIATAAALMLFGFLFASSHAQGAPTYPPQQGRKPADTWEFGISPYMWFAGISGDITVKDRTAHVSVPFSDIWNNLDFGGMVQVEARKGRWGLFLQPNYLKLSPTASLSRPAAADVVQGGPSVREADVRLDTRLLFAEFGGFCRVLQFGCAADKQRFLSIEALAGGRYWYFQNHIFLNLPERGVSFSDTSYVSLIDPMIGFRTQVHLAPKFILTLRGDAAGFGVSSNSSHISWNGVGTLRYVISPCWAIGAGYRYLYINYSSGSGSGVKLSMQGPLAGLEYKF
jgi:hypothetical protein